MHSTSERTAIGMTARTNDYRIIDVIMREKGLFAKRKILDAHPEFEKRDVDRVISDLCKSGKLRRFGTGRSTCYAVWG